MSEDRKQEASPLDKILSLIYVARMAMAQPRMDGSDVRGALEALDEMHKLRLAANAELKALRDKAWRYDSCSE